MLEKIILINKFYRDFCFSNKLIACFWFDVTSFTSIEDKLNGNIELTDNECETMENLLLYKNSDNEMQALEHVVYKLLNDLRSCKLDLEKFKT